MVVRAKETRLVQGGDTVGMHGLDSCRGDTPARLTSPAGAIGTHSSSAGPYDPKEITAPL